VEDVKCGESPADAERAGQMRPIDERDEGFEKLYAREYEPMLRMAFLLLDSADVAQEATHDAFARVYERWARIDDHGAYLRTCVVNRCRDLQRRRRFERARRTDTTASYSDLGARELLDALAALPSSNGRRWYFATTRASRRRRPPRPSAYRWGP
jgi:DNA-directed RNA polymerase specialized sigma24 family protein